MSESGAQSGERVAQLAVALARSGLIQFGQFERPDGSAWPVAVNLRMLPSYPALLRDVAAALEAQVDVTQGERLLAAPGASPLGVALSLRTDYPLVYAVGAEQEHTAAFVFEGAYDVGHPTVLLVDVLVDAAQARTLAQVAARVGLEITQVIAVLDMGLGATADLQEAGFEVRTVISLAEVLPVLTAAGLLPSGMGQAVQAWIEGFGDEG